MKIEIGDKLWFGYKNDGVTDSLVVDHFLLDDKEIRKLKKIFQDIDEKIDGLILLRAINKFVDSEEVKG